MRKAGVLLLLSIVWLAAAIPAHAQGGEITARLRSFDEVPASTTPNVGFFNGTVNSAGNSIAWELTYSAFEGNVTQAHFHIGQKGVNGGVTIFLCSNLGNGPAGTQACPTKGGTINGTITSANVGAISGQSLAAGDLGSVLRAIRAGVVYANVHTDLLPGGSIRGQLQFTASP